jgi:uncharacterized membrane protein YeaQ/YmgE (transglycosylase-associated protein family)
MTNIVLWIISGGLAGWVASLIMDSDGSMGLVGNVIVGIIGAFIGGFLMDKLGHGGAPGADRPTSIASFATAVIGAVVLLFLVGLF